MDAHKQNTESLFVDQDGTNEYCQDKEHCDNNIMTTVQGINNCISTICNTSNYSVQ